MLLCCVLAYVFSLRVPAVLQTISLDEDDSDDDVPYANYSSDEYGTPLPENFDAFDSARQQISNAPPDLLRRKEFYLTPMTLTEAILSVSTMNVQFSQHLNVWIACCFCWGPVTCCSC